MKVVPKEQAKSIENWLSPKEAVTVLAAYSSSTTGSRFLLWSKKQSAVALFPAMDFELVDDSLPSIWVAKVDLNGFIELAPREWLAEGFWDRYHDDDPNAKATFEALAAKLER